ncbi:hypothetical protein CesoFtcFv8_001699 [Champsocephalus esox]|uniref:Uncharacterized protein n=1 Tax=Champsocephalus esox TaxID=159716 RepID=A0AAN8D7I7_9TELE|nr:hypothetical protein CesoFtcFv8_001699 [Champsocephalus esox]
MPHPSDGFPSIPGTPRSLPLLVSQHMHGDIAVITECMSIQALRMCCSARAAAVLMHTALVALMPLHCYAVVCPVQLSVLLTQVM